MQYPDLPAFVADIDERFPAPSPVVEPGQDPATQPGALAPPPPPPVLAATPARTPLWLQMPGEPDRDYGRFRLFLEQGARGPDGLPKMRSLRALAEGLQLSSDTIYRLSANWDWTQRASAWDKRSQPARNFQTDVQDLGRRMLRVGAAAVASLEAQVKEGRDPLAREDGRTDVKALGNLLTQMNQTLRLNEGLSTSNESRHLHTQGAEDGVTAADLVGALAGSAFGVLVLRAALAKATNESAYALSARDAEKLAHHEMLAKVFPFESRHLASQQQLLRAGLYALQPSAPKTSAQ